MFPNPRTIPSVFVPGPSYRGPDEAAAATLGATCHTMPSSTAEDHHIHARTRPLEFSLPSDDSHRPYERANTLLTTALVRQTESQDPHSLRMYQLARASRDSFAARANRCRLRVHELDTIRATAQAEVEEVEVLLKNANLHMDEVKRDLCSSSHTFTMENIDKLASANPPPTVPEFPELGPHESCSGRNTPTSDIDSEASEDWDE